MGIEPPYATKVLARVVEILEILRIPYAIGGSVAGVADLLERALRESGLTS